MLLIYNISLILLLPIHVIILLIRLLRRKENWQSIKQRLVAYDNKINLSSPVSNKLIWLHAASVGESMIALTLVNIINEDAKKNNLQENLYFLVTSGTLSSYKILQKKLPQNASNRFVPIDNPIFTRKFLKKWKPELGIFIESELWPCLVTQAAKLCPLILVNARISDKSFSTWSKYPTIFQKITKKFQIIATQSDKDCNKFKQLGVDNVVNLGNLKFVNQQLNVDQEKLLALRQILNKRKVFVASSTHQSDEEILLKIIKPLKALYPEVYFIIIPRHPNRYQEIINLCNKLSLKASYCTLSPLPNIADDVYIVNSFGELGTFYSVSYISFVGGSFKNHGHNPLEPAKFANMIIFGPDMSNFADIANSMVENKAAIQLINAEELILKLKYYLSDRNKHEYDNYCKNSLRFVQNYQNIADHYLQLIKKHII